jgi:histone H3/H4
VGVRCKNQFAEAGDTRISHSGNTALGNIGRALLEKIASEVSALMHVSGRVTATGADVVIACKFLDPGKVPTTSCDGEHATSRSRRVPIQWKYNSKEAPKAGETVRYGGLSRATLKAMLKAAGCERVSADAPDALGDAFESYMDVLVLRSEAVCRLVAKKMTIRGCHIRKALSGIPAKLFPKVDAEYSSLNLHDPVWGNAWSSTMVRR